MNQPHKTYVRTGYVIILESEDLGLQGAWDDTDHPPNLPLFSSTEEAYAFGQSHFNYPMGPSWTVVHVTVTISVTPITIT